MDRIIDSFPPNEQQQVRLALSESLQIVVSQRLLPRMDGQGQVACLRLLATSSVRNMIRDDKQRSAPPCRWARRKATAPPIWRCKSWCKSAC